MSRLCFLLCFCLLQSAIFDFLSLRLIGSYEAEVYFLEEGMSHEHLSSFEIEKCWYSRLFSMSEGKYPNFVVRREGELM